MRNSICMLTSIIKVTPGTALKLSSNASGSGERATISGGLVTGLFYVCAGELTVTDVILEHILIFIYINHSNKWFFEWHICHWNEDVNVLFNIQQNIIPFPLNPPPKPHKLQQFEIWTQMTQCLIKCVLSCQFFVIHIWLQLDQVKQSLLLILFLSPFLLVVIALIQVDSHRLVTWVMQQ